jgi:hypothetical protein
MRSKHWERIERERIAKAKKQEEIKKRKVTPLLDSWQERIPVRSNTSVPI